MDKKELKFYDAPACEVVELKLQGMLCESGGSGNPLDPDLDAVPDDEKVE